MKKKKKQSSGIKREKLYTSADIYVRDERVTKFTDEYFKDLDGRKALLAAGYHPKNSNVADSMVSELLRRPKVQSRLEYLRRRALKKTDMSVEWILGELYKIARADIGEVCYFDEEGNTRIKPEALEDPNFSTALSELNIDEDSITTSKGKRIKRKGRIRLYDKTKALVDLGKHLGLWPAYKGDPGLSGDPEAAGIKIEISGGLPQRDKRG